MSVALLDLDEIADRAQQVLVHRVVVVHIELHHGDDPAELRDEAAEHAGLVHAPQRRFRVAVRGQKVQENAVGLGIVAQLLVDQTQRAAQQPDGVGVQEPARALGLGEEADEIDGIALEHVRDPRR